MARAGRPRKLNGRMERVILRVIRDNPRQSAVEINRQLKIDQEVEVSDTVTTTELPEKTITRKCTKIGIR